MRKCPQCNRVYSDFAAKCPKCGIAFSQTGTQKQEPQQQFVPIDTQKQEPQQQFVPIDTLADDTQTEETQTEETQQMDTKKSGKGELLKKINGVTKHKGEPLATLNHVTGTLYVYDDRIEFHNMLGMNLFHTISVRSKGDDVFRLNQISTLSNGTYVGLYTTLVVKMKNGNTYSFVPAIPGNTDMETVIGLLTPYM